MSHFLTERGAVNTWWSGGIAPHNHNLCTRRQVSDQLQALTDFERGRIPVC